MDYEPEEEFCGDCGDSIGQEPWDKVCWRCREIRDDDDAVQDEYNK